MGTMGSLTEIRTYPRKSFTILAAIGLLGAHLVGLGVSPAHAAGVEGHITFSDGQGTTHKVDISDPTNQSADIQIEGYEWLGDGTQDGPDFHISCSATLLDTEAGVVGPPFPDNDNGTTFGGWPDGTEVVEIVDFDISRQPGQGQSQECDPGTFDPQPSATVSLTETCDPTGVTYTITNDGDGDIAWELTDTISDTIVDSGTVSEGDQSATLFHGLAEGASYDFTLEAFAGDNSVATDALDGTIDCDDDPPPAPPGGGAVTVVKSVVGDAPAQAEFGFELVCDGDLTSFFLADESSETAGVADNSTCDVEETDAQFADGTSWEIEGLDDEAGGDGTATDTFTVAEGDVITITFTNTYLPEPDIAIVKTATDGVETDAGGEPFVALEPDETTDITYAYEISNTGEEDLTGLSLVDDKIGNLSEVFQDAIGDGPFEAGESVTVTAVHEAVGVDTFSDGQLINVATVEGTGVESGETVTASDDESIYDVEVLPLGPPSISVVKTATEGVTEDEEGNWILDISNGGSTTVGYEYVITNTGDEDLSDLGLVDDKLGDLSEAFQQAVGDDTFEAGDSVTVTADYELTDDDIDAGMVTNVADVDGIGVDTGLPATDSDDETVFVTEVQASVEVAEEEDTEVAAETEVKAETLARTGTDSTNLLLLGLLFSLLGAAGLLLAPNRRGGPGMMQA